MAKSSIDIVISTILKKTGIDAARAALSNLATKTKDFAKSVGSNLTNIKSGFEMISGAAHSIVSPIKNAIKAAFDFETAQTSFAGLLNSIDKSKQHIEDLRRFAAQTPLTFDDLQQASKLLLSFGMSVNDVMPSLKMLGDISMGNAQKFQGLALVFAQVKAAGKLMGQDLLQMINQGFNPLTIIAQKTGKSVAELRDIMSKGGISFEMVAEAMRIATTEGGLFNNAMKDAAQTGNGLISTLQDEWMDALRTFGNELMDVAKVGIQWCINKLKELKESGAIAEWAKKARDAIYTVIGAFKGLSDETTRTKTFSALKDVLIGGFEEAATGAGRILLKAAQAVGKLISQAISDFNPFSENSQWKKEVKVAKEMGIEGIGQWDWSHDNKKGIEKVRAEIARRERAAAANEVGIGENSDGGESRFMRGINALKKLGQEAQKEREKMVQLEEGDAAKSIRPKTEQDERDKINSAFAAADEKRKVEAARKAAEAEEKARIAAEEKLHQQRIANIKAEVAAQEKSATAKEHAISAAQTEFDRAFAMYRDPEQAAAQIAEERDYAADYKQLQKDASRYGGKWRIDELSRLMAAGDTAGQAATLEEWRKSSRFTPEVEAMVRAAAADKTRTTAEDELRQINANTKGLSQKLDELLKMKG